MPDPIDDLEQIDDNDPGSGSKLRRIISQLSNENKALKSQVTSFTARDVISTKGLQFVKVDDLVNLDPDEIETKAAELEQERRSDFESTLRARLETQGLSGSDLDSEVARILEGNGSAPAGSTSSVPEGVDRARAAAGAAAGPVPAVNPANLDAKQKFSFAFSGGKRS